MSSRDATGKIEYIHMRFGHLKRLGAIKPPIIGRKRAAEIIRRAAIESRLFVAMHESASGSQETCQPRRRMVRLPRCCGLQCCGAVSAGIDPLQTSDVQCTTDYGCCRTADSGLTDLREMGILQSLPRLAGTACNPVE
jgi:hypothetical protein